MADDAGSDVAAKMHNLRLTPKYLRLISSDGHEFIVREEIAFQAPTIVAMMKGPAAANGECHLTRIQSHLLSIIVCYLHFKEINPSATWLRGSPPPSLGVPSSLRIDASYAADFLGLVSTGPSPDHIRLISDDGHVFIVRKEIALQSETIRDVLSGEESREVVPCCGASLRLISYDGRLVDLMKRVGREQRTDPLWRLLSEEDIRRSFDSRVIHLIFIYLICKKKYTGSLEEILEPMLPRGLELYIFAAAYFLQC